MKTSKFFLSTLVAAAAMSATAYAEFLSYDTLQSLTESVTFYQSNGRIYNKGLNLSEGVTLTANQSVAGYITVYSNGLSGSGTIHTYRTNGSGGNQCVLWVTGDCAEFTGTIKVYQTDLSGTKQNGTHSTRLLLGSSVDSDGVNLSNADVYACGGENSATSGVFVGLGSDVVVGSFYANANTQIDATSGVVPDFLDSTVATNDATGMNSVNYSRKLSISKSGTFDGILNLEAGVTLNFNKGATGKFSGIDWVSVAFSTEGQVESGLIDANFNYQIFSGDGNVSGLEASMITLNDQSVSSLSSDLKTATIQGKIYSIVENDTKTISEVSSISGWSGINVLGTLDFGDLTDGQNVDHTLTGTGTVKISKTTGNHDSNFNLGTEFAGTVVLKGNFNPSRLTLGNSEGEVVLNGVWFWGAAASFDKKVVFESTADITSEMNYCQSGGMAFNKGATFKEGAKFSINGNSENWGKIELEKNAYAKITGDLNVSAWSSSNSGSKTLTLAEGASLNVSGTLANSSGLTLRNDGTINTGTFKLASGSTDTIEGSGTINATGLVLDNHGTYKISGLRLNIGSNGATTGTNSWGYKLILGDMTLGASADWTADASMATSHTNENRFYLSSTENGGTKVDTGTHSVSIGVVFSDYDSEVGALTKIGAGTLTLSGDNTYSGGTTITAGTLVAASANALGTGAVKIISGATLRADTALTLSKDLTLAVSDADKTGAGLITGSGITLSEGAKLLVDISGLPGLTTSDSSADSIALTLAASSALTVNQDQIQLGYWSDTTWTEYTGDWYIDTWSSDDGILTLSIPEPSAFGLLAGLGALALTVSRRRRTKKA